MRVLCIYLDKNADAMSVAEIFYRATPQIILRQGHVIFLEISKCQSLYSESTFLKRTLVTLKRIDVRARIAIAGDIPTALSFALHDVADKGSLPIACLSYYCDPLGLHPEQQTGLNKIFPLLRSLKIATLSDFLKIPAYEISPRFGPLLLMAYQRLQGEHAITWPEFTPREDMHEKHEFDLAYPPRDLEPVYFVLRPLLEKIFLRLRSKGRRARQFKVILQQEYQPQKSNQQYEILVIIQLPFVSAKTIFQITKEKMDSSVQKKPLEHAITHLSVVVTEEAPYMTSQKDIFDQKKEEMSESFFHLVSRLATKLGPQAAFFAHLKESYLPERNWFRVPEKQTSDALTSVVPERPLRLFKHPIPISIQSNQMIFKREPYEIIEYKTPEVILSNWWETSENERIYYRVLVNTGERFWIFKNKEHYYIHGIFE